MDSTEKIEGVTCARRRTFVCKKVPGKNTDKYMEILKQASGDS